MPSEPNLCPDCPLDPFWQAKVVEELRERQQRYHQTTSNYFGVTKLSHGVEEPSAHKICLARRLKLKLLGESCPYFPASEDISRFASVAVEEEPRQQPEPEEITEMVNPLQAQAVKRRLRQQSIRQRYL